VSAALATSITLRGIHIFHDITELTVLTVVTVPDHIVAITVGAFCTTTGNAELRDCVLIDVILVCTGT